MFTFIISLYVSNDTYTKRKYQSTLFSPLFHSLIVLNPNQSNRERRRLSEIRGQWRTEVDDELAGAAMRRGGGCEIWVPATRSDSQVGAESDGRKGLDVVPFKESFTGLLKSIVIEGRLQT
ncbi:hypothetical protein ACSBR1_015141 [Camellia fascicularis]